MNGQSLRLATISLHVSSGVTSSLSAPAHSRSTLRLTANHFILKGGDKWQDRLHAMQAPLLGRHELHRADWGEIIMTIDEHTDGK
jgi:hypothetical protein